MAIQVECPKCGRRNSEKRNRCSNAECNFSIKKQSHKIYWIDYRANGTRTREKIGRSRKAAEHRLREVQSQLTEDRYISPDKNARINLKEVCQWYLTLEDVKAKKSYRRDKQLIANILRLLDGNMLVKDLNIGIVEEYRTRRMNEESTHSGENIAPSTANKEVACLVTAMNKGVKHDKISSNPINGIKKLKENNQRNRTLTDDEFERLLSVCPQYLQGPIMMAYYLAMRQGEILSLTWDSVDLSKGFIRLKAEDTKTGEKRSVPIHPKVDKMLRGLPKGLRTNRVFLKNGKPMKRFEGHTRRDFDKSVYIAGIEDFRFHDLRHCAITNLYIAGENPLIIMAIAGHNNPSMSARYANPTEDDLRGIGWKNRNGGHLYGHQKGRTAS